MRYPRRNQPIAMRQGRNLFAKVEMSINVERLCARNTKSSRPSDEQRTIFFSRPISPTRIYEKGEYRGWTLAEVRYPYSCISKKHEEETPLQVVSYPTARTNYVSLSQNPARQLRRSRKTAIASDILQTVLHISKIAAPSRTPTSATSTPQPYLYRNTPIPITAPI